MHRRALCAVALALCVTAGSAWAQGGGTLTGGIQGGATSSALRGGIVDTEYRWGGTAGAFLAYNNWYTIWALWGNDQSQRYFDENG